MVEAVKKEEPKKKSIIGKIKEGIDESIFSHETVKIKYIKNNFM